MTYSILARDPETGALGGAAAAGCMGVGGWVLRGSLCGGISASQGTSPSCIWGEAVLAEMAGGRNAAEAVDLVTGRDRGKSWRQLSALDAAGGSGAFTGSDVVDFKGASRFRNGVATGDVMPGPGALEAMVNGYITSDGSLAERLIAALAAVGANGGGAPVSAAILVLEQDRAPLSLRVDFGGAPLEELRGLLARAQRAPYADWMGQAPCPEDPERRPAEPWPQVASGPGPGDGRERGPGSGVS